MNKPLNYPVFFLPSSYQRHQKGVWTSQVLGNLYHDKAARKRRGQTNKEGEMKKGAVTRRKLLAFSYLFQ